MVRGLAAVVLAVFAAACAGIGPGTVPHDRIDYGSAIGDSRKQQTLLNIVKLRYADMPFFLEVAQVIAGYQLQCAMTGSFSLGNRKPGRQVDGGGNRDGRRHLHGSADGGLFAANGVDFLKRLMTAVPPSTVLFMLPSGYVADRIMPIMVDSINGLNNQSNRLRRPADPKFIRLVELMREGQLARAIQIRIDAQRRTPKAPC